MGEGIPQSLIVHMPPGFRSRVDVKEGVTHYDAVCSFAVILLGFVNKKKPKTKEHLSIGEYKKYWNVYMSTTGCIQK